MPTYEYICDNCKFEFEEFQSIGSEPLKICPKCGKDTIRRVISGGIGLIFKGSGFYITDYKQKGNGGDNPKKEKEKVEKSQEQKK
ncbi:MAG: zinc ribbon domain-containing protein [Candidatus Marinimicrobia bacterium]|nr:zinc ribbon domain-containing protein [Candidatus Neomarinimicrobiota bacterium]